MPNYNSLEVKEAGSWRVKLNRIVVSADAPLRLEFARMLVKKNPGRRKGLPPVNGPLWPGPQLNYFSTAWKNYRFVVQKSSNLHQLGTIKPAARRDVRGARAASISFDKQRTQLEGKFGELNRAAGGRCLQNAIEPRKRTQYRQC